MRSKHWNRLIIFTAASILVACNYFPPIPQFKPETNHWFFDKEDGTQIERSFSECKTRIEEEEAHFRKAQALGVAGKALSPVAGALGVGGGLSAALTAILKDNGAMSMNPDTDSSTKNAILSISIASGILAVVASVLSPMFTTLNEKASAPSNADIRQMRQIYDKARSYYRRVLACAEYSLVGDNDMYKKNHCSDIHDPGLSLAPQSSAPSPATVKMEMKHRSIVTAITYYLNEKCQPNTSKIADVGKSEKKSDGKQLGQGE